MWFKSTGHPILIRGIMDQGTQDWLKWRKTGIGSSDTPVIIGVSPHDKTIRDIWIDKTNPEVQEEHSYIFKKGHEMEAKVRAMYELTTDSQYPPTTMQRDFLLASLDGWNESTKTAIEIKYVGKSAIKLDIPPHHFAQVQHLLYVSQADRLIYIRYDGENTREDVFTFDQRYWDGVYPQLERFWKMVKNDHQPEDENIINDKELARLIKAWKRTKALLDITADKLDKLREQIVSVGKVGEIEGVNISKIEKKGAVDYKSVPQLQGVDLEPYRKEGSSYFKIEVVSEGKAG